MSEDVLLELFRQLIETVHIGANRAWGSQSAKNVLCDKRIGRKTELWEAPTLRNGCRGNQYSRKMGKISERTRRSLGLEAKGGKNFQEQMAHSSVIQSK